jgi:hypothetical protein
MPKEDDEIEGLKRELAAILRQYAVEDARHRLHLYAAHAQLDAGAADRTGRRNTIRDLLADLSRTTEK